MSAEATHAVGVLGRSIGLRVIEVTAHVVIAIWLQALVLATLALAVRLARIRGTLSEGSVGNREAEEIACANAAGHSAGCRSTLLALDAGRVLLVWGADAFELPELVRSASNGKHGLRGKNLTGCCLCLHGLGWV